MSAAVPVAARSAPGIAASVEPVLIADGITKSFPGVLALDRVHFEVRPGEVNALLGENGAGKSTLIKLMAGFYAPDQGEITVGGRPLQGNRASLGVTNGGSAESVVIL